MIWHRRDAQPTERDLLALADGSLSASRRARVERAVAASSELQADVAAQIRALEVVRGATDERAPAALRARLELARDPHPRRQVGRPAWATAGVSVAALAAAAVVVLGGGAATSPTVAAAATLATRAAQAPTTVAQNGSALTWPRAAGLPFPNWAGRFGFSAVGMREDRLDGRLATTVFYSRADQRVAYTIVSGSPLAVGVRVHLSAWNGTVLRSFPAGSRAVVTWLRSGHTCVLSGDWRLASDLLRLAAWTPARGYTD